MAFKEQLIQRRKRLGLSQEQLGHRIGVSRQAVSKWELGETTPELEKLVQLSRLFGCSIDQLVENQSGEQEPKPEEPDPKPRPERGHFGPWGPWQYEYKSSRTLFGLPLVHIHIGYGLCTAKGVFALGNCARGIFALGGLSAGVFSLGGISFGLVSLGGFALGLLFAFGGLAVGAVAVGGFALGLLALGDECDKRHYQHVYFVAAAVALAAILALVPLYGATGAAVALVVTEVVVCGGMMLRVKYNYRG